jgi:hypothetical protein
LPDASDHVGFIVYDRETQTVVIPAGEKLYGRHNGVGTTAPTVIVMNVMAQNRNVEYFPAQDRGGGLVLVPVSITTEWNTWVALDILDPQYNILPNQVIAVGNNNVFAPGGLVVL